MEYECRTSTPSADESPVNVRTPLEVVTISNFATPNPKHTNTLPITCMGDNSESENVGDQAPDSDAASDSTEPSLALSVDESDQASTDGDQGGERDDDSDNGSAPEGFAASMARSLTEVRRVCERVIVWGLSALRTPSVWLVVQQLLCAAHVPENVLQKVVAVSQVNGQKRHDLYISNGEADTVVQALRRARAKHQIHARASIPWRDRCHRFALHRAVNEQGACSHKFPKIMTLNIHSLYSKRTALEVYLREGLVNVCGLQETWRTATSWKLRIHGYQSLERAKGGEGSSGVALLVADGLHMVEVGKLISPFFVFARVSGHPLPHPVIFGTVYIPPKGVARREALKLLKEELAFLRRRFDQTAIALLGDFNHSGDQLDRRLTRFGSGLVRQCGSGAMNTFHRNCKPLRDIDHICVSVEHGSLLFRAYVDRTCDLSDHWPVVTTMAVPSVIVGVEEGVDSGSDASEDSESWVFIRPDRWASAYDAMRKAAATLENAPPDALPPKSLSKFITHHNRFAALALEVEGDGGDAAEPTTSSQAVKFTSASHAVGVEAGIRVARRKTRAATTNLYPRAGVVRAINAARAEFARWARVARNGTQHESWLAKREYLRLRKHARTMDARSRRFAWQRFVAKSIEEVETSPTLLWRWAKRVSGVCPRQRANQGPLTQMRDHASHQS